mgnify:FL=1
MGYDLYIIVVSLLFNFANPWVVLLCSRLLLVRDCCYIEFTMFSFSKLGFE